MNGYGLMVGDWVMHDGKAKRVDSIKGYNRVWLLDPSKIWGHRYLDKVPITEVQPIPLTAEILEKNGFIKRYNYQWEYRDNSCTIVINIAPQIEIDGEILGTPPINLILEGALFNINMTSDICVHNLQHALRLCGIEKEVIL